jgi:DNA sulfur modification protein DndB
MTSNLYPCVQGTIGDWTYYVTIMRFADAVRHVKFAEQVCPSHDLDKMIQRRLTDRSKDIAEYLSSNPQRFFGSLIVAAYDGKPQFLPIKLAESVLFSELEGKVGVLRFDGSEQYYALDGQHRLAAMKCEVARAPDRYVNDQVSIIVICHTRDTEGMSRARRLFTTVNRYAKKTSPAINDVMDEDNGVAIITRRLIRTHPFFQRRIKILTKSKNGKQELAEGNAMSAGDTDFLMGIGTFRKCNADLLPERFQTEFSAAQRIPAYENLESAFTEMTAKWDTLIELVGPWKALLVPESDLAPYRTKDGGHVLVRPIGITAFIGAFATVPVGYPPEKIREAVEKFGDITAAPWNGVFWNAAHKKMGPISRTSEKLARRLWRYLFGLDEDKAQLETDWRAIVDPQHRQPDLKLPDAP